MLTRSNQPVKSSDTAENLRRFSIVELLARRAGEVEFDNMVSMLEVI